MSLLTDVRLNPLGVAVSLIRSTPPAPPWLGTALAQTLQRISQSSDLDALFRAHKFRGSEDDRRFGAEWLSHRFDVAPAVDRVLVTNGTQNALLVALAVLAKKSSTLLVEEISYYAFRRIAEMLGIRLIPVAMDDDGVLPDALNRACQHERPSALYLQPTLHNPTSYIMSRSRRESIIDVVRKHNVPILEDDVYGFLCADAPPPIAALAPDICWYASGPAKCIAPGLRIGYLVAPHASEAERCFANLSTVTTWHTSPLSAEIAAAWIADGTMERLRQTVRTEVIERQEMARRQLAGAFYRSTPESIFMWLTLPERWSERDFIRVTQSYGVVLRPGSMFAVTPSSNFRQIRIVLGSPDTQDELRKALDIIAYLLNT